MSDDVLVAIAQAIALKAESGGRVAGTVIVGEHGHLFDQWGVEFEMYGPDRTWANQSACQDVTSGQSLWFWPGSEGPNTWEAMDAPQAERMFCRGCSVQAECYAYALEIKAEQGVWGGIDFGRVKMDKMREARRRTAVRKDTT